MLHFNLLAPREGIETWHLPGRRSIFDPKRRFVLNVNEGGVFSDRGQYRKVGPWRVT